MDDEKSAMIACPKIRVQSVAEFAAAGSR